MDIELITPFTKVKLEPEIKKTNRKQVGILGGKFNPVHYGHLVVADQVRQQLFLDKVLLMPKFTFSHSSTKEIIDERYRVKMLELAIEGIQGLEIGMIDMDCFDSSCTYSIMKFLIEKYPKTDYYFIIGADMIDSLPHWCQIDEMTKMVRFVGVQRPRYKSGTSYPIIWVDVPQMDISSSMVRDFISRNREPHFLLPSAVLDYIEKEKLYK